MNNKSTRDEQEVDKFDKLASEWWNPYGKFRLLHKINPLRLGYVKSQIAKHYKIDPLDPYPFKNLKVLDIGCGGGLVSVPMHIMGAEVTGIDASDNNIKTASVYAKRKNLDIAFINKSVEELGLIKESKYNVIIALEVIEHVLNYELFLNEIAKLLEPSGVLIISTINRTLKALFTAKIGAEYILRMLPIGTHEWNKFLKPSEIDEVLMQHNLVNVDTTGMTLNLLSQEWTLNDNIQVNYFSTYSYNNISEIKI